MEAESKFSSGQKNRSTEHVHFTEFSTPSRPVRGTELRVIMLNQSINTIKPDQNNQSDVRSVK